jgi:ribosomal protein L7Ae-like RNA K-turn-binding protein
MKQLGKACGIDVGAAVVSIVKWWLRFIE